MAPTLGEALAEWLLGPVPHTENARRRALADLLRQTTSTRRAPATDVTTLLTTANALLNPSTTIEIRHASGPMADMARHSLLHNDTKGTHLTDWTLDF